VLSEDYPLTAPLGRRPGGERSKSLTSTPTTYAKIPTMKTTAGFPPGIRPIIDIVVAAVIVVSYHEVD